MKHYREERESELRASLDSHLAAEKSAVDLAQTVIKSAFLLNGGGIIAIPAIVALFHVDAAKSASQVVLTGELFISGLLCGCIASIAAFFALAHKSDCFRSFSVQTARNIEAKYFPSHAQEMTRQAHEAGERTERLRRWFVSERYAAIFLCVSSIALFAAGAWIGGRVVLQAPHTPAAEKVASSSAAQR